MMQLEYYDVLDITAVPQTSCTSQTRMIFSPFFITHIEIYCVNYIFLSVEMYKGSKAAEKNKKPEYEHV